MSLVCFIWEYLRKRIRCPLNEKMENQRIPLLLKLSSENIVEARRKFLFPLLRLSPESFLVRVSWIIFVFNLSFYLHCRDCPWRSFLTIELFNMKPQRSLYFCCFIQSIVLRRYPTCVYVGACVHRVIAVLVLCSVVGHTGIQSLSNLIDETLKVVDATNSTLNTSFRQTND